MGRVWPPPCVQEDRPLRGGSGRRRVCKKTDLFEAGLAAAVWCKKTDLFEAQEDRPLRGWLGEGRVRSLAVPGLLGGLAGALCAQGEL